MDAIGARPSVDPFTVAENGAEGLVAVEAPPRAAGVGHAEVVALVGGRDAGLNVKDGAFALAGLAAAEQLAAGLYKNPLTGVT